MGFRSFVVSLWVVTSSLGLERAASAQVCMDIGEVCRDAMGPCDKQDFCSGGGFCADQKQAAGTVCRPAADVCDLPEVCDGASSACPFDAVKMGGVTCRAETDLCDAAEICNGSAKTCPSDGVKGAGLCRAATGPCDEAELCNGAVKTCPGDARKLAATVCAVPTAPCETDALCDGFSTSCPSNPFLAADTLCGPSQDVCDLPEYCTGTSRFCPMDVLVPTSMNLVCRPVVGACDAPETCNGTQVDCPPDLAASDGTTCDDSDTCTNNDACMGGLCVGEGACPIDAGPPDPDLTDAAPAGEPDADFGGAADGDESGCSCRVGAARSAPGGGGLAALGLIGLALAAAVPGRRRLAHRLAVALLALLAACGGDGDGGGGGGPAPYTPPPEGPPPCELSVDCSAGTHCDLGECVQTCNREDACESGGLACSDRGRCVVAGALDRDPDPTADKPAELLPLDALLVPEGATTVSLTLGATPADVEVRYRVDARVPWLALANVRGDFTGSTTIELTVNRPGLAAGVHAGTIDVFTSVGNVSVPVTLSHGVTGVYDGELTYTAPLAIGTVPLRIEVREQAGQATLWISPDDSPTFALDATTDADSAFLATYASSTLTGELVQVFDAAALGGADSFFGSDVADEPGGLDYTHDYFGAAQFGRRFTVELHATEVGGLAGTFKEIWIGLLPAPVQVEGTILLQRKTELAPREVAAGTPLTLPPNPSGAVPPDLSQNFGAACSPVAQAAGAYSAGYCNEGQPAAQLVSCGRSLRTRGYRLESPSSGLLITDGSRGYAAFTSACGADLAATDRVRAYSTQKNCFWLGNAMCGQRLIGLAAGALPADAAADLNRDAADRAAVALLLLNDGLARVFELPYKSPDPDGVVADQVLQSLGGARRQARYVGRYLFRNVHLLQALATTAPTTAQLGGYLAPRRVAQFLHRYRLAFLEEVSIRQHVKKENPQTLRAKVRHELATELLAYVVLGAIFEGQAVPAGASHDLATDGISPLGQRYHELQQGLAPFGLPAGFVPFLYDPNAVTPDRNTNFQFVLDSAVQAVAAASGAEVQAQGAIRDYDTSESELSLELDAITNEQNQRLVEVCGPSAGNPALPDLAACETNPGGLYAQAVNESLEAIDGVRLAQTNIEVQHQRVLLHRQRMIAIHGIREDTIKFVNEQNEEIDQAYEHQRWYDALSSMIGFAVGVLTENPALVVQSVFGFGDAVVSADLEQKIRDLEQAKEMRLLQSETEVEYINLMTELKELELQFLQLAVEFDLALKRAITAKLRIAQLHGQRRAIQAESALQAEQALGSLKNDPTFRVIRDRSVARAIALRDAARRASYLAAIALEYELNQSFGYRDAALAALRMGSDGPPAIGGLGDFIACMDGWFRGFRESFGAPQTYVDEISLREDVFGIHGPITDAVTGEVLSEAEQFRRRLLLPTHLGRGEVVVGLGFATSIGRENPIFSPDVCNDQVRTVQVKLVGDGLGDDQATVILEQGGATFLRGCESYRQGNGDVIREYHVIPDVAVVYAGVNDYPETPADTQLFGRSVAASQWTMGLPRGQRNADVDFTRIEDIILLVEHSAYSLSTGLDYAPTCTLF